MKTKAFRSLFSFTPEHVEENEQFHRDNGDISCFEKFPHIYNTLHHEDLSEDQFENLPFIENTISDFYELSEYLEGKKC
jgi:beta-phosphoglucomutase